MAVEELGSEEVSEGMTYIRDNFVKRSVVQFQAFSRRFLGYCRNHH